MDRRTAIACLGGGLVAAGCSRPKPVLVGAKDSTEQSILGEIVAQLIEKRLGRPAGRRFGMGRTRGAHQGLLMGEIDLYPEYSGTALTEVLNLAPVPDAAIAIERVRLEYRTRFQCEWMDPLGFDNPFSIVVRAADAEAGKIETLSDAAGYPPGWRFGTTPEFLERIDGYASLTRTYRLRLKIFTQPKNLVMPMYKALSEKRLDMLAGWATDGMLSGAGYKVLQDDKGAFAPNQACVVARGEALERNPGLREALVPLHGKITEATMRTLNYRVDAGGKTASEVAAGFVREAGLG